MSDCLMSQRGGKYSIGRTITDDNVIPIHSLFERIWHVSGIDNTLTYPAVDNQGNICIPQSIHGIEKLSSTDGTKIWLNNDYTNVRSSVAIDSNNDIYVVYQSNKSVRKLSGIDGTEIWSNSDFSNAWAVAIDSDDNIYVTYQNTSGGVRKLSNKDGTEIWHFSNNELYSAIEIDNNNDVIVNQSDKFIRKLSGIDGKEIWNYSSSETFRDIIVISKQNNDVYIIATNVGLQKLSAIDGNLLWTYNGINNYNTENMVIDNAENLYIGDNSFNGILVHKISVINYKEYGMIGSLVGLNTAGCCGMILYKDYIYLIESTNSGAILNKCYRQNIYKINS